MAQVLAGRSAAALLGAQFGKRVARSIRDRQQRGDEADFLGWRIGLGEHGLQFREFLLDGVVTRQASRSFELADPGVQWRGLVMRRAELAQPGMRIKLQMPL